MIYIILTLMHSHIVHTRVTPPSWKEAARAIETYSQVSRSGIRSSDAYLQQRKTHKINDIIIL